MRRLLALTLVLAPSVARAQDTLDQAVANDLTLELKIRGLEGPTGMEFLPDGRLVIIQQGGKVLLWDGTSPDPDLTGTIDTDAGPQPTGERGLLGLAVDPMFMQSRRLYFYYSEAGSQRVSWTTLDAQNQLDTNNLTTIIQNLSANRNHVGGGLQFGPDGNLYIGVGDTGCNCGCDPGDNTNNYFPTCLTEYHGKILRIDRDGNAPATNPLVRVAPAPECGPINQFGCASESVSEAAPLEEIYLWGFRNPWRFSFDSQTGYLWIGDVGEITWEEITISKQGGEHHGWPFREGMEGLDPTTCSTVTPQATGDCVDPAFAYPHAEGPAFGHGSITGGVFSNHCSWPAAWNGLYWFGDYNKTRIWTLTPNATRDGVVGDRQIIVHQADGPVHFTTAPDGSIWYATINNEGQIYRIAPKNPASCPGQDAGMSPDAEATDAMESVDADAPDTSSRNDTGTVADTGLEKDAGSTGDAASGNAGDAHNDEDCGCTATSHGGPRSWWLAIGLFALATRRLSATRSARRQR